MAKSSYRKRGIGRSRVITLTVNSEKGCELWNRFSSMTKLQIFVAYALLWKNNGNKVERHLRPLSKDELREAETRIIQFVQREDFNANALHAGVNTTDICYQVEILDCR